MSNKKTIPTISSSEASKMSVSALAVRPNDASRFGQGGLSAKALQEWFDKLPNLVKEKFNDIAEVLASSEAAKYIGTDALGVDNLYDFLLLFGPRGTGLNDKNISDYIETLYAPLGESTEKSVALKDIVSDIARRLVDASAGHVVDAHLESVTNTLVITFADGTDARVDLSPLAAGVGVQGEIDRLKETDADFERRLSNIEEHISDDYFVTDDSVAYEKAIPARACSSAKLLSLGGMTYLDEETNTLRDSKATEIKNYGANLMPYPYLNTTKTVYGITFTDNGDGTITANGTATGGMAAFHLYSNSNNVLFEKGKSYTISDGTSNPSIEGYYVYLSAVADGTNMTLFGTHYTTTRTFTNSYSTITGISCIFVIKEGTTVNNLVIKPMINFGSTVVEYKPYREPISYPIPAEIQAIEGYGKDGFNIDLSAQTSDYNGSTKPLPVFLDPIIEVEGGGSLEFVNEYKNPVPSAVKYLLKEESAV